MHTKGGFFVKQAQLMLGAAAALALTGAFGGTASAATGQAMFADVPSGHWAYQAVAQLQADGLVKGMDGEHFHGDAKVTRYQMAQIVARAMANADNAAPQDQALLDKLSHEFDDEIASLHSLSRRVDALEKQQKKTEDAIDIHGHFQQTLESHNHAGGDTKKSRWWAKELYFDAEAKLPGVIGDWKFKTQLETKWGSSERINQEELMTTNYNGGHSYKERLRPNLAYVEGSIGYKSQIWARAGILQPWVQNGYAYGANLRGVMLEHWSKKYVWHVFGGLVDSSDGDLAVGAGASYDNAAGGWGSELAQPWNDNVRAHKNYQVVSNAATDWKPRLSLHGNLLSEEEQAQVLRNGGTGSDNAKGDLTDMFGSDQSTKKTIYAIAYDRMFSKKFSYNLGAYRYTSAAYNREPLYVGTASFDYKVLPKTTFRAIYSQGNQHGENSNSRGWMLDLMWNCSPWMGAEKPHMFGAYVGYHYLAPDSYVRCGYGDGIDKGQKGVELGMYYNLTHNFQYTIKYGFGKSLTYTYAAKNKRDKLYTGVMAYF